MNCLWSALQARKIYYLNINNIYSAFFYTPFLWISMLKLYVLKRCDDVWKESRGFISSEVASLNSNERRSFDALEAYGYEESEKSKGVGNEYYSTPSREEHS